LKGTIQEIAEIDIEDLHPNLIHRKEITTELTPQARGN